MATSKTIHFKAFFKGKAERGVSPYCTRFALHQKYGEVTENKDEVNCTRCAKQLNITPAAKQVSSTRGTCQCCFGGYETRQQKDGSWTEVLHGYQRPGVGYIIGACRGQGYVPYEVSCEQTKVWLQELKQIRVGHETRLENLKANKIPTLTAKVVTGKRIPHRRGWGTEPEYATVEVPVGQGETPNPFQPERPYERVPSYQTLRNHAISSTEMTLRAIDSDITFLTEKIETWKPVAFPVQK